MASKTNLVRPSRDGDQFHYLWAARRSLRLLSTLTDLVAISIEGPSPNEKVTKDAAAAGEEIIDIAEYFGSREFETARLVRYMQLKHSTLHGYEPWTASGLEKTIKGFAKRYKKFRKEFPNDDLSTKLQFWFVTNRPIDSKLAEAIADAATSQTQRHPDELKKVQGFTKLTGNELKLFCRLMHFESGQADYWNQRNILTQDVSHYLAGSDADAPLRLKELVNRKALSEGESNPDITKMDVLRVLNADINDLFPANCLINEPTKPVIRNQEQDLINAIRNARHPVIVHASAGVGKTVFSARISHGLPKASACILYDCFGNALYRSASKYRHRHRDGLVQIANELSAKGLCHLLIPTALAGSSEYVKAFMHRLRQAVLVVRGADPEALLCIVIDAADNAQMAAEEMGEGRSFVRDLIREKMPDGVRFVFLCRTHRVPMLAPPIDVVNLELTTFNQGETASHLRTKFPDASDHDVSEFHRLSSENPRVQALALSSDLPLSETLRSLGPNPTTVDSMIGALLENAIGKLKDGVTAVEKKQIEKVCVGLAALRPLVPISVLAKVSGVPESAIRSFAMDLGRPLLVTGDMVQFFDEPAETWFREKFKPSADAAAEFIKNLKPLAAKSVYVASVLPQLMLEAGRFSELVELVLTSTALPETSPYEKRDVELQRLQFSLKAALRSRAYPQAAKLALKAGGEAAGDDRQRKIIEENIDLAGAFFEIDTLQDMISRKTFGSGWVGSHHVYEASLMSNRVELVADARSRLRLAHEWLANWNKLPEKEREEEEISDQDILELTLAHMNINGPERASRELRRWRPREVSFRVGRLLVRRLIDQGRLGDVEKLGSSTGSNFCLAMAIVLELAQVHCFPTAEVTRRAFRFLLNKRIDLKTARRDWRDEEAPLDAINALLVASLHYSICAPDQAVTILTRYLPKEPPRGLSSQFSRSHFPILRGYCLSAALQGKVLELRELAHRELKEEMDRDNKHSVSRELREFRQNIGMLFPWHKLWINAALGRIPKESLVKYIDQTIADSKRAEGSYYEDDFYTKNEIALLWVGVLNRLNATDPIHLGAFLQWKDKLGRSLFTPTLAELARLCGQKEETKQNAIAFVLEAFNLTKGDRGDAESKANGYISASRSILAVSKADAKAYFDEAIDIVSKIGDENSYRWNAILDLADRSACKERLLAETAYRLARCAELTYEHVARDKHFDWRSTVKALCGLCPSSALTILSRWRDRKFGSDGRNLPVVIEQLIKNDWLHAFDALALIGFRSDWDYKDLLSKALAASASSKERGKISAYLSRYARLDDAGMAALKNFEVKGEFKNAEIEERIAYLEMEKKSREYSPSEEAIKVDGDVKDERNWDNIFSGCDIVTANGLSIAHTAFKATESPWYHEHFFQEAIRRAPAGSEPALIGAISSVPEFDLYTMRAFIEAIPENWHGRPAIMHALSAALKLFLRRHCMEVTKNRYYEVIPFKKACALAGITQAELVGVILDAIGETAFLAKSERLFSLVGLLTSELSEDQALEVLNFGLDFFNSILEENDGDGPWSAQLRPPADVSEALAGYIWASLASPSSVLRWEGSHAVLGLVALGRKEILGHLVKIAKEQTGVPFVDAKLPFYSLHALQWLLIAFSRAAPDHPKMLVPFAGQLIDWATKGSPHVLIRLFSARTALALLDKTELTDDGNIRNILTNVGKSPFPPTESKSSERYRRRDQDTEHDADEDRFAFSLDIGPYWYAPLAEVFGVSQKHVEQEALRVIRGDFGTLSRGYWDEDERARRHIYEENHASHSHGSYPLTDNLHFYYSYHAMMVVAGKLLATQPTHRDTQYGEEDEFADWLIRHDISRRDGRWLWERRDMPPPKASSWKFKRKVSKEKPTILNEDFEEALDKGDILNIWGCWTEADSSRQRTFYISSGLVSPSTSNALLRALSTAKSPYDYAIPYAGTDMEINYEGFSLNGWIVDGNHHCGLDSHDWWSGGVDFPPPKPAENIVKLMQLKTDIDCREWRDDKGNLVLTSRIWGHFDERLHHETVNPEKGTRLETSRTFMMAMLQKLNSDLIVEVKIHERRIYGNYYSSERDDDEKIPETARIFLLSSDGRIRS